ncbi:unnamed protein product [Pleuronectes platessa]|uniref:Uncharacterized protein n=1 Tax=Pleuronectes platessa TaxID=8262 RepID=A0A9N7V176_PLEPL|nr:unnamed protein product [Pleuronectes platessa]
MSLLPVALHPLISFPVLRCRCRLINMGVERRRTAFRGALWCFCLRCVSSLWSLQAASSATSLLAVLFGGERWWWVRRLEWYRLAVAERRLRFALPTFKQTCLEQTTDTLQRQRHKRMPKNFSTRAASHSRTTATAQGSDSVREGFWVLDTDRSPPDQFEVFHRDSTAGTGWSGRVQAGWRINGEAWMTAERRGTRRFCVEQARERN